MSSVPTLPFNPELNQLATYMPDIPFAKHGDKELRLQLLLPSWACAEKRCPLIIFVQGSSWTIPNAHRQLPQLSAFAQAGMAVASVSHRSRDEAPFPAFLEDVKTAIRFMRANAATYGIDPARVAIWGTSSGGNAALLTGMTADAYHTADYPDESSRVTAVVSCFGPTDIRSMIDTTYAGAWDAPGNPFEALSGKPMAQSHAIFDAMSPTRLVRPGMTLPPFLLLHGDGDDVVGFDQSEACYNALIANGYQAELYRVPDAPHEKGFWSQALLSVILRFLQDALQA